MSGDFDQQTLSRERRFGGSNRWSLTVAAIGSIFVVIWLSSRSAPLAVCAAILGALNGIGAVINWRNWLKKSELEKASLRFLDQLQLSDVRIPMKRDEFDRARRASHLNLSISAMAFLYICCGVLSIFSQRVPISLRIIFVFGGIIATWMLWSCGRRFLRGAKMLTCPTCKNLLTSQSDSVLKTGRCCKCDHIIFID
jgi:hypothetical protein